MADSGADSKRLKRSISVCPLRFHDKQLRFGARVTGVDLANISDADFNLVREALHEHLFLVFPNQYHVDPEQVASFAHRFDPEAKSIWRDQATNPWERFKAEHMGPAGTFQLPEPRQHTLVLGKGEVRDHYGLSAQLGGPRPAYGKDTGSQVIGGGKLQWHIDGAFWQGGEASGLPCEVVCMRCCESPISGSEACLDVRYGDGAVLRCPLGSTAFVSAHHAFDLLTPQERSRALRTTVHYAAHPFKRFAKLGMTADGLRCVGGAELETAIANAENRGQLALPLVWTHPVTGRQALMPHTRCLESLEVEVNGKKEKLGLEDSRDWLRSLMRRAVEPELVYAHAWMPGDVALWDNRGVWHSATGGLREGDRRVMHLVAFDGSVAPRQLNTSRARRRVLALVIGQTPREDLVAPLKRLLHLRSLSEEVQVEVRGALDRLSVDDLQRVAQQAGKDGSTPLITKLADGSSITVSESAVSEQLQKRMEEAATEGFCCAILLCAGAFDDLTVPPSLWPLLRPIDAAAAQLRSLRLGSAVLLEPSAGHREPAVRSWQARLGQGTSVSAVALPLKSAEDAASVAASIGAVPEALILDFVGHDDSLVESLRQRLPGCVVLDVASAAFEQLCAILTPSAGS